MVLGGGKVVKNEMREDVSLFVDSISDGWTIEDGYTALNHESKLTMYLPVSTGSSGLEEKVAKILTLIDKMFFVSISYWWEKGMGLNH